MNPLPSGTVTLLFSDMEGSTRLLQALGERYAETLAAHHALLRACFENHQGRIVDTQGDSFFVAFPRALDAVRAAIEAQRALAAHAWGEGIAVRVRMGLHTGEPRAQGERYVGLDVHRAARIGAAGHGGQILLSETTFALIQNDLPRAIQIRDLGKHRLKDFDAPASLYQIVCADLSSDFPPLKTLDARPHNLSASMSSFIGRERELAELERALHTARLLTLIGVGGAGKTRLALEFAEKCLDAFPDGAWFIELARLHDATLIPQLIASALGVRDESGDLAQTLKNFLARRKALLVFDNCEHLIDGAAQWAEILLRAAPHLKIVATSREGLNLAGEQLFHVSSLPLPEATHAVSPATLLQSDAARLFVARATAANDHFRVTEQNAPLIAQICRRLDGIPLALELAAARTKALSVEQIAARLDDVFRLLTGGSRAALPRQQTLAAAIDWSYALLSQPERLLLQRLSVFAGGWTLEAAEQVCGEQLSVNRNPLPITDDRLRITDVLDLLAQLVNKSLVVAEPAADGTTRYRFLETIRQFARYRLYEAEAVEAVSDKHLDFFVAFAETARVELRRPQQGAWLERLDAEHDNLRAALTWALGENPTRAAQALRLTGALWMYWDVRGYFQEGLQWCERALAASDAENAARFQTIFGAGGFIVRLGNLERAMTLLDAALALARKIDDARSTAEATLAMGFFALLADDLPRADALLDEALARFEALGDPSDIGRALGPFAERARRQNDYARAAQGYAKSLALFRQAGDLRESAGALNNLANVGCAQGAWTDARLYAREGLELYTALADKHGIATSQRELGRVAFAQGDLVAAHQLLEASRALFQEMGDATCLLETNLVCAALLDAEGANAPAIELAWQIIHAAQSLGGASAIPAAKNILARAALHQGELERARQCVREALQDKAVARDALTENALLETAARLAAAQNDFARAAQLLGAAHAQRERMGLPRAPREHAEMETLRETLRVQLGENFGTLWEEGRALSAAQAKTLALGSRKFTTS